MREGLLPEVTVARQAQVMETQDPTFFQIVAKGVIRLPTNLPVR